MALPFYRALRAGYPKGHVTLLAPVTVSEISAPVDEVIKVEKGDLRGVGLWRLALRLREKRFDLGITLPASFSSALLLWLAGIPLRVGFAESPRPNLFLTSSFPWPGREGGFHKSELYLQLLNWMSVHAHPQEEIETPLSSSKEKRSVSRPRGHSDPPPRMATLSLNFCWSYRGSSLSTRLSWWAPLRRRNGSQSSPG